MANEGNSNSNTSALIITGIFTLLPKAFPWVAIVWCTDILVGKTTNVNVIAKIATDIGGDWIPWATAAGFAVWGVVEKLLKRRTIKRYSGLVPTLEKQLNPQRQSSGLLPTGQQREGD
jgi:hypothetical protein